MYIYKLTAILISALCGNNIGFAQQQPDYFAVEKEEVYWKMMAGSSAEKPILIRFEQPEQLLAKTALKKKRLENLNGRIECRMIIALHKNKVKKTRIYWVGSTSQISVYQRTILRKVFREMNVDIIGQLPQRLRFYKTTWVCALKEGKLKKI
jgi:hypothetical protein